MKLVKSIITHSAIIIAIITICGIFNKKNANSIENLMTYSKKPTTEIYNSEPIYLIYDAYTSEHGRYYYIDEVVENTDKSISFIDEDGLITRIPYPYYTIQKIKNNENTTKSI